MGMEEEWRQIQWANHKEACGIVSQEIWTSAEIYFEFMSCKL